jgi:hypothetical protein
MEDFEPRIRAPHREAARRQLVAEGLEQKIDGTDLSRLARQPVAEARCAQGVSGDIRRHERQ